MTVMTEPVSTEVLNLPTQIELLGRRFVPAQHMTIERDMYVMSLMRKAKITELFNRKDKSPTFELDDLAEQIIIAAFESGKIFEMTAAVIDEVGVKWTMSGSVLLADWLSKIEDQGAKNTLMQYIAAVILGFFLNGPGFSATLSESLALAAKQAEKSGESETSEPQPSATEPTDDGELNAEPTILVNGEDLSGSSPDSTPSDTMPSSSGP